jgi:thymidylate kinase
MWCYIRQASEIATHCVEPDITFVLDCGVGIARERLAKRAKKASDISRYDEMSVYQYAVVREKFLKLAETNPLMVVLDASQEPDAVVRQALRILKERFGDDN